MTARTVRLIVALALAGLLGQSVGALADYTPVPPLQPPPPKFSTAQVAPSGQLSSFSGDGSWSARTPYVPTNKSAPGPTYTPPPWRPPPVGQPCQTTYTAGVSLAPAQNGSQVASWVTPKNYYKVYNPATGVTGWYLLDQALLTPGSSAYDAPSWDGSITLSDSNTNLPGNAALTDVIPNQAQAGSIVTYALSGKIAEDAGNSFCLIDKVVEQGRLDPLQGMQPWCSQKDLLAQSVGCQPPQVSLVPPPTPPCQTVACLPKVQDVIPSLPAFLAQAKSMYTDGGTVVAVPHANMELVQLLATFTLTGDPVTKPTQYMTLDYPVNNGGTSQGVVSYQIRIGYKDSYWYFDDTSSKGPYPAEHPTDQSFVCAQHGPVCTTTQDYIGHWQIRVVDTFSVDFREAFYYHYPDGITQTDWASFPGASTFQLCAKPATNPPPDCGPGTKAVWGQIEAIPFVPRLH